MKNRFRLSRCVTWAHSCSTIARTSSALHSRSTRSAMKSAGRENPTTATVGKDSSIAKTGSGASNGPQPPAAGLPVAHHRRGRAEGRRRAPGAARQERAAGHGRDDQRPRAASRRRPPARSAGRSGRAMPKAHTDAQRAGQHAQTEQQRGAGRGRVTLEPPRQRPAPQATTHRRQRRHHREAGQRDGRGEDPDTSSPATLLAALLARPAARARPAADRPAGSLPRRRTTGWARRCRRSRGCSARATNARLHLFAGAHGPVDERAADLLALQHAFPVQPVHRRHQRRVGRRREIVRRSRTATSPPRRHTASSTRSSSARRGRPGRTASAETW